MTPIREVNIHWLEFQMLHHLKHLVVDNADRLPRPAIQQLRVEETSFHAVSGEDFYADLILDNGHTLTIHVVDAIQQFPEAVQEYIRYATGDTPVNPRSLNEGDILL